MLISVFVSIIIIIVKRCVHEILNIIASMKQKVYMIGLSESLVRHYDNASLET